MPTESRREGKHNHIHERSFISKTDRNSDRIFAEYTQPVKKEYLTGRWYAPEDIIVVAPQSFSPHISDCILRMAEQHLGKIVTFGIAKSDKNEDPTSLLTLPPHEVDLSYSSSYLSQLIPTL